VSTNYHQDLRIPMRRPPRCYARSHSVSANLFCNYGESDATLVLLGMIATVTIFLVAYLGWSV
jgi:hypothetical protein